MSDTQQLAELAAEVSIHFENGNIYLDEADVSVQIRDNAVTLQVRHVADNPAVRRRLIELQRTIVAECDIVTEGRDQGTEAFPHAECKIFLTASPEERAKRRQDDLQLRGEGVDFQELLEQQNRRDKEDTQRSYGRLIAAPDAIEVVTDGLTQHEVVDRLADLVRTKRDSLL